MTNSNRHRHRDREDQIAKYEDGPRTHRLHTENDIGKHYLLETYLNGLHDIDAKCGDTTTSNDDKHDTDKELTTPGNSDSGVNTEEIATSPDVGRTGSSSSNSDTNNARDKQPDAKAVDPMESAGKRDKSAKKAAAHRKSGDGSAAVTSREAKLRAEHQLRKEFCEKMEQMQAEESASNECVDGITAATADTQATARKELNVTDHLAGQIELLEKVISINKHIQREEELLVRLNAKVRKCEVADPSLSETEMKKVLDRINANIDESSTALAKTEHELSASHQVLMSKAQLVEALNEELKALELTEAAAATGGQNVIQVPSHQIQIHSPSDMVGGGSGGGGGGSNAKAGEQRRVNFDETATVVHLPAPAAPAATPPPQTPQATAQFGKPMKTGTLPKLISSVLKKTSQLSAKNTFSGTIPKVKQQPACNRTLSTALNCNAAVSGAAAGGAVAGGAVSAGSGANAAALSSMQAAKNNSASVADQLMLSQAPLFYQKANANGVAAMQLIDQRNLKANNFNVAPAMSGAHTANGNCNSVNLNNSTLANCSKIGPKKLINGFYKDPDSDTGLGSFSEELLQHVGTLV